MAFTAKDVAQLRERTGCGMMDCKKALTEANGDMDAAIDFLREKGLAAAAKKAGRIAAEGVAYAATNEAGNVGVVIEVNAETDFVAKNDEFNNFVKICAQTVMEQNPADVDALLACKAAGSDETIADILQEKILTIGENIKIRRFARSEGAVVTYIHGGGRIGVLVEADTDVVNDEIKACLKNVAMQVAAMSPKYTSRDEVDASFLEHEKEILLAQAKQENPNKPDNIIEKMIIGRLNKEMKEICLLDQVYVQDSDLTVAKYVEKVAKENGANMTVKRFVRFETGEGLEKKNEDFAAEVAAQMNA